MPAPGVPLERQGFLTLGTYDADDPAPGHERPFREVVLGEELGFDSVWLRHRHFHTTSSRQSPGLAARFRYGGGSRRSVRRVGEQGLAMLISNVIQAEDHDLGDDASGIFEQIQQHSDDVQVLTDVATKPGPAPGWSPR